MSEQNQPVVEETNAAATPVVEESNAQDNEPSLDELLSQFETEVNSEVKQPETKAEPIEDLRNEIKSMREERQNEAFRNDMDSLVETVKGDAEVDETFVEAWIDAEARKDQRLANAWAQRRNDPRAFKQVQAQLTKKFASAFPSKVDQDATADKEAVTAAMTGTGKAPETPPPDFSAMNNAEFRDDVRNKYGFTPPV